MSFNKAQQTAITHKDGAMLVLAGPGSGKTTVITHRVRWLIDEAGVNPANILVVTFTKAAATEMKERFNSLMEADRTAVNFGTLHSVFFTILRHAYNYNAGSIITEDKRMMVIKEIIHNEQLEFEDEADFVMEVLSEISLVKGTMTQLEHYYSTSCSEEIFKRIYNSYQQALKQLKLIDFDDMNIFTYELLKAREDILKAWSKKFQYILIDEFQDVNLIQYMIIKLLVSSTQNLFIVGDDDQSIYKFRGAKPEIMLNFKNDFPDAKEVLLDINYRCSQNIVNAAGNVIQNNEKRFSKDLKAFHGEGPAVAIKSFENHSDEYLWLIREIECYHREHQIPLSEMAVLFRTNIASGPVLERLMEYNIPFKAKDRVPNIYEHWIAKNIFAYLHAADGSRSREDILQIINRPNRFVSRQNLGCQEILFDDLKEKYLGKDWMIERIVKLEEDLELLRFMKPYAAISYIRSAIGYENYLSEYAEYRRINKEELLNVLDELEERAKPFKSAADWFLHVDEYAKALAKQSLQKETNHADSVSLMTMHSAKGLEFSVVFIIDANEGIIPHQKAVLDSDIEEERRMFYVALTRAKQYLHVYFPKERFNKRVEPSRFVSELMLDKSKLRAGADIKHKKYGRGTIKAADSKTITVCFSELKQTKKLDINYCITSQLLLAIY